MGRKKTHRQQAGSEKRQQAAAVQRLRRPLAGIVSAARELGATI